VHGTAAVGIEVMRSRLEPWGGVGGMNVHRCEESCWHACEQRFPQDESKCVQVSGAREFAVRSDSCRATRCRVPRLHWGQHRLSADFCGPVSSVLLLGVVAWRWILHRARTRRRLRLASSPKWRTLTKPEGRTWSRKRRMNSTASRVMTLLRLLCLESRQRKRTCPLSRLSSLPLEMAKA
jgi:hypothetical protein